MIKKLSLLLAFLVCAGSSIYAADMKQSPPESTAVAIPDFKILPPEQQNLLATEVFNAHTREKDPLKSTAFTLLKLSVETQAKEQLKSDREKVTGEVLETSKRNADGTWPDDAVVVVKKFAEEDLATVANLATERLKNGQPVPGQLQMLVKASSTVPIVAYQQAKANGTELVVSEDAANLVHAGMIYWMSSTYDQPSEVNFPESPRDALNQFESEAIQYYLTSVKPQAIMHPSPDQSLSKADATIQELLIDAAIAEVGVMTNDDKVAKILVQKHAVGLEKTVQEAVLHQREFRKIEINELLKQLSFQKLPDEALVKKHCWANGYATFAEVLGKFEQQVSACTDATLEDQVNFAQCVQDEVARRKTIKAEAEKNLYATDEELQKLSAPVQRLVKYMRKQASERKAYENNPSFKGPRIFTDEPPAPQVPRLNYSKRKTDFWGYMPSSSFWKGGATFTALFAGMYTITSKYPQVWNPAISLFSKIPWGKLNFRG